MPPKKKKTRSTSKSTKQQLFPKLLVAALLILLVIGISTVKYFQSPGGRARLLDAGYDSYYAQVQEDIGMALRGALGEFDLRGKVDEQAAFETAHGKTIRPLQWRIACDQSSNYVLINVALTRAVRSAGGTVRHSEETDGGKTFLFTVGTRNFDTHRLKLMHWDRPAGRSRKPRPLVAIVIDDFGYSRNGTVKEMIGLDLPLTIAILPSLPHSVFALKLALARGQCAILHLPMEPDEDQGGDLAMVTTDMDAADVKKQPPGVARHRRPPDDGDGPGSAPVVRPVLPRFFDFQQFGRI
jgi:hypothetical protein